ncbi:hypothetical protein BGX20_005450, partial [Mortierella sp. AD010]
MTVSLPPSSSVSSARSAMTASSVPVLIAGAGPVGLFEAFLLTKLGIQVRIIEREMAPSPLSKALGMQPRSLEIFEMAGIVNKFLESGKPLPSFNLCHGSERMASIKPDVMAHSDSHYNSGMILEQAKTSEILVEELEKVGVKVDYGWELLDTKVVEEYEGGKTSGSGKKTKTYVETKIRRALSNDNTVQDEKNYLGGINLLEDQDDKEYEIQVVRSEYLVATDGGRSTVRHKLNIGFPGRTLDFKTMMWDGTYESDLEFAGIMISVDAGKLDPNEDLSKTMENLTVEKFEKLVSECIAPATFKVKTTSWLTIYKINERRAEHFV